MHNALPFMTPASGHRPTSMSIGGATYDLFVRFSAHTNHTANEKFLTLPLGAKIRVDEVLEASGGGACNTAVGLSRLGCQASFAGILASDQWGQNLLQNLQKEGVDTSTATIVDGEVSSFSLILSGKTGERVILYEPGVNEHLHDSTFARERAKEMDWVYLNHIQENSCVIQDDLVAMLAERGEAKLTWNPGGCQLDMGLEAKNNRDLLLHTDLLLVNKEEALKLSRKTDMMDALKFLLENGAKHVCITDGKHGTTASDGTMLYHCPTLPNVQVIDTTGAGDAFGTGVTWGLMMGLDLPTSIKAGTINAASVVSAIGAQAGLLTDTEMRARLETNPLSVSEKPL